MTAVKEQFMQMLPDSLSGVPDIEVQYMINTLVKWNNGQNSEDSVERTFGKLKDKITYVAPDFDSCIEDDPKLFGLEEHM